MPDEQYENLLHSNEAGHRSDLGKVGLCGVTAGRVDTRKGEEVDHPEASARRSERRLPLLLGVHVGMRIRLQQAD